MLMPLLVLQFLNLHSANTGKYMTLFKPKQLSSASLTSLAPQIASADQRYAGLMMKTMNTKKLANKINLEGRSHQANLQAELLSGGNIYQTASARMNALPNMGWLSSQDEIDKEVKEKSSDFNLSEELYGKKGTDNNTVVNWSHYNDDVPVEGYTRNAGGAPKEVQQSIIKQIIQVGRTLQSTDEEIATALAIARHESGFNPYAAARISSAYGIGQFLDGTGKEYGLNQQNRDDVGMQIQALIEFTQKNFETAKKRGKGLEYVYKYHHDGSAVGADSGGLALSQNKIMPFIPKYLKIVEGYS